VVGPWVCSARWLGCARDCVEQDESPCTVAHRRAPPFHRPLSQLGPDAPATPPLDYRRAACASDGPSARARFTSRRAGCVRMQSVTAVSRTTPRRLSSAARLGPLRLPSMAMRRSHMCGRSHSRLVRHGILWHPGRLRCRLGCAIVPPAPHAGDTHRRVLLRKRFGWRFLIW
jgi:hypothetical protein